MRNKTSRGVWRLSCCLLSLVSKIKTSKWGVKSMKGCESKLTIINILIYGTGRVETMLFMSSLLSSTSSIKHHAWNLALFTASFFCFSCICGSIFSHNKILRAFLSISQQNETLLLRKIDFQLNYGICGLVCLSRRSYINFLSDGYSEI